MARIFSRSSQAGQHDHNPETGIPAMRYNFRRVVVDDA
jgi:hypothetical protein